MVTSQSPILFNRETAKYPAILKGSEAPFVLVLFYIIKITITLVVLIIFKHIVE